VLTKIAHYNSRFLALGMKLLVGLLVSIGILQSCGDDQKENDVLGKAPFNKITDSIQQQPNQAPLHYRRGVLLYQNNQLSLAQQDIQKAWNLTPNEEYGLSLATILLKKNADTAIQFLQGAIQRLPQSIALQMNLAKAWQEKGNAQEALNVSNTILTNYPNSIDALLLKAELLKSMDQPAASLQALEQAYALAPFDAELVHNLAFEYAQLKNPKVLALSDSLIRSDINSIHAEPYYFKGLYFENTGNTTEALKQLDAAIQHDYYFLDAHMEKGQIFYNQKKYADALKAFQLATTITPTFVDAYYWLGKTKEAMGNKAEAKLDYQRAYGLDKTNLEAKQAAERL
jgi:tetratricopeptide (TPR) repeat protein